MSRAYSMLLAAVLLLAPTGPATPQTQAFVTLAELRNLVRPLLIFAPAPGDPLLELQISMLNEHARETRALSLLPIGLPFQNATPTPAKFTDGEAASLRRRFQVAPGEFVVILLDDQGSEISRSPRPLSIRELAQMIKSAHRIVQ